MLFECDEVIQAIKGLATTNGLPADQFERVSLDLMCRICLKRIPSPHYPYYQFRLFSPMSNSVGFSGVWIGRDPQGKDVRIPGPLIGAVTADMFRTLLERPIHVLESKKEFAAWFCHWRSYALMPEELAKGNFPLFFDGDRQLRGRRRAR